VRVVLCTGKGGVGKTTVAAATAVAAARSGLRTLVISTDPAHSLEDALGTPVAADPAAVPGEPLLHAQHVDSQRLFEQGWADVRDYLLRLLDTAGFDPIAAEELTVLPGAEEVLALLELRRQAESGEWDAILIDCAPTGETLRLLALPEALQWYLARTLPSDRRLVRALAPVVGRVTGVTMPESGVATAARRLAKDLLAAREILTRGGSTVRLVLTPESVVLAESRRALTMLSLHGYRVDGVVANRIFPAAGSDEWRAGWVAAQQDVMHEVADSFGSLPLWRADYLQHEPVGVDALAAMAESTYGDSDPVGPAAQQTPMAIRQETDGWYLSLALPLARKGEVGVLRVGRELVITVGSHRRVMALPAALVDAQVKRAGLADGRLWVRFITRAPGGDSAVGASAADAAAAATAGVGGRSGEETHA
jgi:arsenite-transporting ATPase